MTNVQAAEYMRETYFTSNEKTALAITIANRERDILKDIDYEKGYSLYVGIPFCPSICLYCSFSSSPLEKWRDRVDEYLSALLKELDFISGEMKDTVQINPAGAYGEGGKADQLANRAVYGRAVTLVPGGQGGGYVVRRRRPAAAGPATEKGGQYKCAGYPK